jgi:hypothetical protein
MRQTNAIAIAFIQPSTFSLPTEHRPVSDRWVDRARRELLSRRGPGSSWRYRDGGSPAVEPTALAGLAMLASGGGVGDPSAGAPDAEVSRGAAAWLAGLQRADGSLPAGPGPAMPGWATPHAMLLWHGLGAFEYPRRRARAWLLSVQSPPVVYAPKDRAALGHDPTLIGWSWVAGTHSWLEPTAMAVIALCGEGCRDHPRVRRGLDLIANRAIPGGGWNYGNNVVFGRVLRPQPGPTGMALLALAARGPRDRRVVAPALEYLRQTLPSIRAASSVGWGVLGLKAHQACPPEASSWLEEAYERCTGRSDATIGLSLLLLASGPGTLVSGHSTRTDP